MVLMHHYIEKKNSHPSNLSIFTFLKVFSHYFHYNMFKNYVRVQILSQIFVALNNLML